MKTPRTPTRTPRTRPALAPVARPRHPAGTSPCLVCDRPTVLYRLDRDGICPGCAKDIDRCDPYAGVTPDTARAELDADPTLRAASEAFADAAWEAMTSRDGCYDDSHDVYGDDGVDVGMPALPSQMGYEGESLGLTAVPMGGVMGAITTGALRGALDGGW